MIVYLCASTNNRASTVHSLFMEPVERFGLYHQGFALMKVVGMLWLLGICYAIKGLIGEA